MAKIVELIYTTERRDEGTKFRLVHQLFSKDGKLVAEYDPCTPNGCWIEFSGDSIKE